VSEPIGMNIEIGGNLPANLILEFLNVLRDNLADLTGPCTEKSLRAESGKSSIKWFAVPNYGECDEVKEFCRKHDLSYIHHIEAKYEYDAELHVWTPDMKEELDLNSTQDGEVMVNATAVRPLCDLLMEYIKIGPKAFPLYINVEGMKRIAEAGLKSPARGLVAIRKRIQTLLPVEPTIPPFVITKG
jgi:hypothetical protein